MARRSVDRRLDKLLDAILPPGSHERRVHELPDDLREALRLHQAKTSGIISHVENIDPTPGAFYARLIDGDATLPQMPQALRLALGIADAPEITEAMTLSEIAAAYTALIEDQP